MHAECMGDEMIYAGKKEVFCVIELGVHGDVNKMIVEAVTTT